MIKLLHVTIPSFEKYDEATNTFSFVKGQELALEHSLLSLSKWESKWKKPFISREPKSLEESIDYVRCMTTNKNINPELYYNIPPGVYKQIEEYIDDPMTATWIRETNKAPGGQVITSELIYYWMVSYRIPFECQKWHLNRLIMLIRVCDEKNKQPKKMSRNEILRRNASLNAARRAKLHSRG